MGELRGLVSRFRLPRIVIIGALTLSAGVTGSARQDPDDPNLSPVTRQSNRAYFGQLPFEQIDMVNGNLLFSFTDLALPGNAGLDLRLVRSYSHQSTGGKWTFGLAGIPVAIRHPNGPLPNSTTNYPSVLMGDGGSQQTRPVNTELNDTVFSTADFSLYTPGDRKLRMPNGWVATFEPDVPSVGEWAMLLSVTDPYQNVISPTWEPSAVRPLSLKEVLQTVNGQTRTVKLSYTTASGRMPKEMRLVDGITTGQDRIWTYEYGPTLEPDSGSAMLREVIPPAGSSWTFAYTFGGYQGTDSVQVTTPNGGTVSYSLPDTGISETKHRARISTRTTGGRDVPVGVWTFSFFEGGTGNGKVTLPDGRILAFLHEIDAGASSFDPRRWILKSRTLTGDGATSTLTRLFEQQPVTALLSVNVVTEETLVQDGLSYHTDYDYSDSNFGDYHRPNTIVASSGGRTRKTVRIYQHKSSPYLTGLMTSEIVTVGAESTSSSFTYDSNGFLTDQTIAGVSTTFAPTPRGDRLSSTDAHDHETTFTYQWGVVANTITPEYTVQRIARLDGQVISETRNGAETTFDYDDLGRPTKVTPPAGLFATETQYFDNRVETKRDNIVVTTFIDGFGRPVKVVSATGVCVRSSYDTDGRKTFESDPSYVTDPNGPCNGTSTDGGDAFQYDFLGRVTQVTHADDTVMSRSYDTGTVAGTLDVTITDENDHDTVQRWEAFGNPADAVLRGLRDAEGKQWLYEYNHLGSLTKVVAPAGSGAPNRTWQCGPATGRLDQETHPESGTTVYTYDVVGNLKTKTDAKGQLFTYAYDDVNRLKSIDAPGTTHDVSFEYDDADNRTRVKNGSVDAIFRYDDANLMYQREVTIGTRLLTTKFDYDRHENLKQIEYPSGRKVNYTYDDDGRPLSATDETGTVYASEVVYYASGLLKQLAFGNGHGESVEEFPNTHRPKHIDSGPLSIEYSYDNVGNVKTFDPGRGFDAGYDYDSLDRLINVSGYGGMSFEYDELGNRKKKTSGAGIVTYTYDTAKQRLSSSAGVTETGSYVYDNNGNTEQDLSGTYQYTPFNMVSQATVNGATTVYAYDGDGTRVRKSDATRVRYFVQDPGGRLLAEHEEVGSAARSVREYVYLGSRLVASIGRNDEPAPAVTVTSPIALQRFPSGEGITIQASVANASGVTRVEFYANGLLLGSATNSPYTFVWSSPPPGQYSVLARLVPQSGVATPSAVVPITVFPDAGAGSFLDLNGDGLSDVFTYDQASGEWTMAFGQANGSFTQSTGAWNPGWTVVPARFNPDARTDLFLFSTVTGQWYRLVNEGATGFSTQANGTWWSGWQRFVLDLDADGISDLFLHDPASGNWYKALTTATDFAYHQGGWAPSWEITPMTLNTDAFGDLFLINRTTGRWFWVLGEAGAGFSYPVSEIWFPGWVLHPGDFNGDDVSDLLLYDPAAGSYVVALNNEAGYDYTSGGWSTGWALYIGDLDADGDDDVFLSSTVDGQWYQMMSGIVGNAFSFSTGGNGGWSLGWIIYPTDFNADGRTDFLLYNSTSGVWYQARNLTLGTFSYTTGTWPANLTIVGTWSAVAGGQAPAPEPLTMSAPAFPAIDESSAENGADELLWHGPAAEDSRELSSSSPPVLVTLTLDLSGTGAGNVSGSSGWATCTGAAQTCSGSFEIGTSVTLTATPNTGHEFLGWSGACSGIGPCTVSLSVARYASARFWPIVTHYYHLDALGSVRAVTRGNGTLVRYDDYHAFGEAGTPPMGDPIRFTGKERDAETALDYFQARYYRNMMGRFTTADPDHVGGDVFDPQSWNAYAYARNNPLRFIDPTGTDYYVDVQGGEGFWIGDREFDRLSRNPGAGISLIGGFVVYNGRVVGSYQYFTPFSRILVDVGRRGQAGLRGVAFVGAPSFALASWAGAGAAVSSSAMQGLFGMGGSMAATLSQVANKKLHDALSALFQVTDRMIGGTAAAVDYTRRTGQLVGGSDHLIKAGERIKNLETILRTQPLNAHDRRLAEGVLNRLKESLR